MEVFYNEKLQELFISQCNFFGSNVQLLRYFASSLTYLHVEFSIKSFHVQVPTKKCFEILKKKECIEIGLTKVREKKGIYVTSYFFPLFALNILKNSE